MTFSLSVSISFSPPTWPSQSSGLFWSPRSAVLDYQQHQPHPSIPQPDKFWNADHEKLYRRTLILLLFLSLAAVISVEVIMSYYYQGKTKHKLTPCLSVSFFRRNSLPPGVLSDWKQTTRKLLSCSAACSPHFSREGKTHISSKMLMTAFKKPLHWSYILMTVFI